MNEERLKKMLKAREVRAKQRCTRCLKPGHVAASCPQAARPGPRPKLHTDGFPIREFPAIKRTDPTDPTDPTEASP